MPVYWHSNQRGNILNEKSNGLPRSSVIMIRSYLDFRKSFSSVCSSSNPKWFKLLYSKFSHPPLEKAIIKCIWAPASAFTTRILVDYRHVRWEIENGLLSLKSAGFYTARSKLTIAKKVTK